MKQKVIAAAIVLVFAVAGTVQGQLPTPAGNTITVGLVPDPLGGKHLLLRVEATEVTDLYGFSFDIQFSKKRLRWKKKGKAAGAFFSENESAEIAIIAKQKPRGTVHVGATRLGDLPGVSGSGILVDIGFVNRKKPGPRDLILSNTRVFDSTTAEIPDVIWEVVPFESDS